MGKNGIQNIIDAETIHSVKDLEWIAKVLANGFLHGKHDSGRLGSGMEFQQYRPYVIGDDIRNIDWKMFAKTDKYFVKQTSIQTEHRTVIIIDNSLSMKYQEGGISKLLFAKIIVAAITKVLSNQGDLFSWQSGEEAIPLSSGLRHWQNSMNTLFNLKAQKKKQFIEPIDRSHTSFFWITDLYYDMDEIEGYFKQLKGPKSELVIFHIMGEAEKTLDFSSATTFVDLETEERIDVNAPKIKKNYQEKLSAHINKAKNLCFEYGVHHELMSLNKPISESISKFFHHYQLIGLA